MSENDPEFPLLSWLSAEREAWDKLSEDEKEAQIVASNYAAVQRFGIGCLISWDDQETPQLYPEDPDRHCRWVGSVLDFGEDEQGDPWVLMNVVAHEIQLASDESVLESFEDMYSQAYPEPEDIIDGLDTMFKHRENFPETATYLELPLGESPRRVYIKDMPTCVFSTQTPTEDE